MPHQFASFPYVTRANVEEEEFDFLIVNEVGRQWYDIGHAEQRAEMRFIRDRLVKTGDLAVECGCHHGFTTILLSKWVGSQGRVIAFDANRQNTAIAAMNMGLNRIANVEFHACAVGNHTGTVYTTNASNARVASALLRGEVEVKAVRLDDFLAGRTPDLIKIDVEGYELEVLKGLRSTLDKRESNLAIEIHCDALRNYGATTSELLEFVGLEDYLCWLGVGAQANDGIQPFVANETPFASFPRVYLFSIPRRKFPPQSQSIPVDCPNGCV